MKPQRAALLVTTAGLILVASGCASGPTRKPGDPLEPMNRAIFKVNDTLDRAIARPVARGYQKVTPHPIRQAITNFFSNLGDVNNFANNLLQLKIADAAQDLMRVAINTTFGVGGLIDFATQARLPKHNQDFGLTLGRWGVPAGPYLVLPLFGPSSVRDSVGRAVDTEFSLLNYVNISPAARNPLYVTQFVSARSDMLGASDLLYQAALDPYSFVRDAYTQQRESALHGDSATSAPPPPDYGDPDDADEGEKNGAGAPGTGADTGAGADTGTTTEPPTSTDPAQAPGTANTPPGTGAANDGATGSDTTTTANASATAADNDAATTATAGARNSDIASTATTGNTSMTANANPGAQNGTAASATPATNTATTAVATTATAMATITTNAAPTTAQRELAAPDTGAPVSSTPATAPAQSSSSAPQTALAYQTVFTSSTASGNNNSASAARPDNATHAASAPSFRDSMAIASSIPITLSTYRTPQTATYIW